MKRFLLYLAFLCCFIPLPIQAQEFAFSKHQTLFGTVELTSCTTALRHNAPTYLAVAIFPKEGWHIHQVNLTPMASNKSPIQLFTPFQQPLDSEQLYPISALLPRKTQNPVTFSVEGDITACTEDSCTTEPILLSLTLGSTDFPVMTPMCSAITLAISNTPIPMHMNTLKGWAIPKKNGTTEITLDFKHTPDTIQLYDTNKQPINPVLTLHKRRMHFFWPTQEKNIKFYVRTNYHFYEIDLPLLSPDTSIPQFSFLLFWSAVIAAFSFIFLSAFPIYWARITNDALNVFRKQTLQMMIFIFIFACATAFVLYTWGILPLTAYPFSKGWTLAFMGFGLLLAPAHPLLTIALTLLAPKPYLSDMTTLFEQTLFLTLSSLLILLAFILQFFFANKIFTALHNLKINSTIWWIVHIPWIFLMIYTFCYL